MISFKTHILLIESFRDAKTKWINSGETDQTVEMYIDRFKEQSSKNQISGKEKDIGFWMNKSFDEFRTFVKNVVADYEDKQKEKSQRILVGRDAIKVFENDKVLIVIPKTHLASCKYGANTKWCITERDSDDNYKTYMFHYGFTPYFFIFKSVPIQYSHLTKVCVMIAPNGWIDSVWDSEDDDIFDNEAEMDDFDKLVYKAGAPNLHNNLDGVYKSHMKVSEHYEMTEKAVWTVISSKDWEDRYKTSRDMLSFANAMETNNFELDANTRNKDTIPFSQFNNYITSAFEDPEKNQTFPMIPTWTDDFLEGRTDPKLVRFVNNMYASWLDITKPFRNKAKYTWE